MLDIDWKRANNKQKINKKLSHCACICKRVHRVCLLVRVKVGAQWELVCMVCVLCVRVHRVYIFYAVCFSVWIIEKRDGSCFDGCYGFYYAYVQIHTHSHTHTTCMHTERISKLAVYFLLLLCVMSKFVA